MAEPVVISDFAQVQAHEGGFGPNEVEFRFGELAVDVIAHATADELFAALLGKLPDYDAMQVMMTLQQGGLTFDAVIEAEEATGVAA